MIQTPVILPLYRQSGQSVSLWQNAWRLFFKLSLAAIYGALVVALPPNLLFLLAIPIMVMLALFLWLMPDRGVFPFETLCGLSIPFVIILAIWPNYVAINLPGLPWITPTRFALGLILILLAYSVATSSVLRVYLIGILRSSRVFWTALLAWEASQVITIALSRSPAMSATKFVDNQMTLVGVMLFTAVVISRRGLANRIAYCIIGIALFVSLEGMVELKMGHPPWAEYIPSFMRIDPKILKFIYGAQARAADGAYRVRGSFSVSLTYAEYLAVSLPFVLHTLVSSKSLPIKVLMGAIVLIITYAILISQSRLGLVSEFAAMLCFSLMWGIRKWRRDEVSPIGPMMVLGFPMFAAGAIILTLSSATLSQRILGGGAQASSDESRAAQRRMALPKILANPIGHGLGTSGVVLGFTSPSGAITVDNYFITLALDIGLIGLFSFIALPITVSIIGVITYFRTDDHELELLGPIAISMMIFVIIKSVLSQDDNHCFIFVILGMALALYYRSRNMSQSTKFL